MGKNKTSRTTSKASGMSGTSPASKKSKTSGMSGASPASKASGMSAASPASGASAAGSPKDRSNPSGTVNRPNIVTSLMSKNFTVYHVCLIYVALFSTCLSAALCIAPY